MDIKTKYELYKPMYVVADSVEAEMLSCPECHGINSHITIDGINYTCRRCHGQRFIFIVKVFPKKFIPNKILVHGNNHEIVYCSTDYGDLIGINEFYGELLCYPDYDSCKAQCDDINNLRME